MPPKRKAKKGKAKNQKNKKQAARQHQPMIETFEETEQEFEIDQGLEFDEEFSFPRNFAFSDSISRNETNGKGFGLTAKRKFCENEIVFQEFPLFAQQLITNEKAGAACCCFCLRALASPLESLHGLVPDKLSSRIRLLPYQNQVYHVPEAIYCQKCMAMYCCMKCKQADEQRGHEFLCFTQAELESESHPFSMLRSACLDMDNHLPLLFGRMISLCIYQARKSLENDSTDIKSSEMEESIRKQWTKYFSGFCAHNEIVSDEILQVYQQMTSYIQQIFKSHFCEQSSFLQPEFFKSTLDMLNVNQQLVVPRSPFDQYWNALTPEQESAPRAAKVLGDILEHLQRNQIAQVEYSVGGGMLTVHHNLNHSCDPNCKVASTNADATLSIFALRDIEIGEEICFDYIDSQFLSYQERQNELFNRFYFHCLCPKCEQEKPKAISGQ